MATARGIIVDRDHSGFYHCMSRCVRRAFLCGDEFEHRREWVQDRLRVLARLFAIEVCGYAVMSNHLHVVLWTDPEQARRWSRGEVARRWVELYPKSCGVLEDDEASVERARRRLAADVKRVELLRKRLSDLSWFMRCLCEPIARDANREDECTGRFWEGRFKCQVLLDETAVLACVVYVDLNVIRAKLASTPEHSDYTSAQDRIRVRQLWRGGGRRREEQDALLPYCELGQKLRHGEDGVWLVPIEDRSERQSDRRRAGERRGLFGFSADTYLALLDATGRVRGAKRGSIPQQLRPILERLEIDAERWLESMTRTSRLLGSAMGSARSLVAEAVRRGTSRVIGALDVYARPRTA